MSKTKGFSVSFWIILSHEVSRHFPTYTSTYANFENLLHICGTLTGVENTPSPADLEDDLPQPLFTGVTSRAGAALLVGSPSTRLISEAGQLARQIGGPNRDRPSMIPCQTPHMFGTTCASITVWLKTILSGMSGMPAGMYT